MAKDKIAYVCSNCGFDSAKWIGKCPSCGEWNTFKEFRLGSNSKKTTSRTTIASSTHHLANQDNKPLRLNEISGTEAPRINMNDGELNRVLGGGLVRGSITLLVENQVLERVRSQCKHFYLCLILKCYT